ncbi:hypothetical protein M1L60_38655 [Actinoplanes sp. TRM 88003]|uniref:Uncharacterized protein n=1 Tax=Paractinoplanes aksuensis TaxID=2939490 RepID=A0ABT1E063_9ACTN|nr:hypothetical protein [Actinoplanes aksuensis]MCO8276515.1 hypothetical protein [Actinoplanes aksuensis]
MASSLFGPGNKAERSAQDIKAAQDAARAADERQARAAAAAGRDRRSIGRTR